MSLYEGSEDVRWLYVGCRCPACGLTAVYGDWKNEFNGYRDLLPKFRPRPRRTPTRPARSCCRPATPRSWTNFGAEALTGLVRAIFYAGRGASRLPLVGRFGGDDLAHCLYIRGHEDRPQPRPRRGSAQRDADIHAYPVFWRPFSIVGEWAVPSSCRDFNRRFFGLEGRLLNASPPYIPP